MKKVVLGLFLLSFFIIFPPNIYAANNLIKPNSRFYFLQSWGESIRLFLTISPEQKVNYLLSLTEKRVQEMESSPSQTIANRYENHYQELNQLTNQFENKEEVAERIRENSLRQQLVLARVYNQVPEPAKEAILNAQENSAKHVTKTVEAVEGSQKAQEYVGQVSTIQKLEKMEQVNLIEQIQMEASSNADPSTSIPKDLKGVNELKGGQQLNITNPGLENKGSGNGKMEQAAPAQMNAPAGQK